MFGAIIKKIVGSKNERELKKLWPIVERIGALEQELATLTDDQLRDKTSQFKERHAKGESLDALLPEAFAVCREAGKRVLGMRHFDVHLIGRGVHVVTVNDYLAKRDSEWMGKLYSFLGLTVGVIVHGLDDDERRDAYNADITYGTNNEFGFDYLRDNMKFALEDYVQRDFHYAIVDEVDSI